MKHYIASFIVLIFLVSTSYAQQRHVSVLHENQIFSYTITRYAPAWEVQSGEAKAQEQLASEHSKLFRKVNDVQVSNLKNLLYAKGFVPSEVERMNGSSMENYLAGNRLVMHYRIQYNSHTIFLAHLNNSKTRSVIPFLIEKGHWILDPDFAEADFFNLISMPYYNAFTGNFDGLAISDLGCEEIEVGNKLYDYSGRGNSAIANKVTIVDGRIGGAIKLNQDSEVTIDLRNESDLKGTRFSVDMHLNVQNNIFNKERKRVVLSAKKESGSALEISLENGFLHIQTVGSKTMSIPYNQGTWFHLTVKQSGKKMSVDIDGEEMAANTINAQDVLAGAIISLGGRYSFKGNIDELRVSK